MLFSHIPTDRCRLNAKWVAGANFLVLQAMFDFGFPVRKCYTKIMLLQTKATIWKFERMDFIDFLRV